MVVVDAVLGAVLLALVLFVLWLRRYVRTESFRHSDLRRATFELLVVVGPFFGVRLTPPEPEPSAVLTPKGDDPDPGAGLFRMSQPGQPEEHPPAGDDGDPPQ